LLVLLTLGGTGVAGWYFLVRPNAARPDLLTHKITKERFRVTITDRGSLEPADNTYLPCKVKAKTPGQASTSIRWVIDNGSPVKKDERILELDDSALQDQQTTQEIEVYKAEELWKKAELQRTVDTLTNETDVETKKTAFKVAEIGLQEYLEGQFLTARVDLKNKLDMSQSDLFMWQERAAWSERMARPGRQYVTVSQAEADESRHKTAQLTMDSYKTQLRVLDTLTKKKNEVSLGGAIDDARNNLRTAEEKLKKTLELDNVAVESARAQYLKQISKLQELKKDIDDCLILAPRDGMVVYYVEERARFGQSSAGVIAQGELVKEGQKLVAVPDLSRLVVNARIHEAMVARVISDKEVYTGASTAIQATQLFNPQPFTGVPAYIGFDDREARKDFEDANPDLEKKLVQHGMDATVRVNAFPDRPLKAHVKWVSPVASQTDFFSSDIKVYQTYIAIDDTRLEGLKPGMDVVVTIFVDTTREPVVTIPLQALMGGVDMGEKRNCFVMVDGHPEIREITLGKTNERVAEVKEGLKEDDTVILNPAILLSEKEKAMYGVQSGPSEQGGQGGQGDWKGKGKGKGKGGQGGQGGQGDWKGGGQGDWKGKGKGGMPGGGMPGGGMPGGGGGRGFGGPPQG
jgi:multidrug efflux pump subunit AcrA (membrane-fusion protein)